MPQETVKLNLTYVSVSQNDSIVLSANYARKSLVIFNRNTGLADIAFGTAAVAGQSLPLAAASTAGGMGGGYVWGAADGVDQRAVHAICAAGVTTNLVIVEGQ